MKNTIIRFIEKKKIRHQFSAIWCLVHRAEPVEDLDPVVTISR